MFFGTGTYVFGPLSIVTILEPQAATEQRTKSYGFNLPRVTFHRISA